MTFTVTLPRPSLTPPMLTGVEGVSPDAATIAAASVTLCRLLDHPTLALLDVSPDDCFLDAVRAGLADVETGRVLTTPEIKKSREPEFGPIAWR